MSKKEIRKPLIGFIGQGFIGKNYADDFERRGYQVVRYSMEEPYIKNKSKIKNCDIVFIAVPTPTTPEGFDYSLIESVIPLVGKGKIAVIKSTILPGTTEKIQKKFTDRIVMHAPEFLSEATAARDAAFPDRNVIGVTKFSPTHEKAAQLVLSTLPRAPYWLITGSKEAELIKYARNTMGYARIVFVNLLYDLSQRIKTDWSVIEEAIGADPDNGPTYSKPVHKTGRGAGGHCFIKDFAALKLFYEKEVKDLNGLFILESLERKNNELLLKSKKDLGLLEGVYGKRILNSTQRE
jgi:UDPglucose 6-dehydrogenase